LLVNEVHLLRCIWSEAELLKYEFYYPDEGEVFSVQYLH
jgi:hypothetical protein